MFVHAAAWRHGEIIITALPQPGSLVGSEVLLFPFAQFPHRSVPCSEICRALLLLWVGGGLVVLRPHAVVWDMGSPRTSPLTKSPIRSYTMGVDITVQTPGDGVK